MNPLTNVANLNKINEKELSLGVAGSSTSWHAKYKDSAWIYIGGIPYDLSEGDIICVFSQYGEIVNINLVRDQKTGKSKGFCFVCYEDQRSTILAVDNLNGFKLLGRVLRVDHVENYRQPKETGEEDEVTKRLREVGCAPRLPSSESEAKEEELLPYDMESKKQKSVKKKKKKVKKEKKKKKSRSSTGSDSGDEMPLRRKHVQDRPGITVKQERVSPETSRSEANSDHRVRTDSHSGTKVKQEQKNWREDQLYHRGSDKEQMDVSNRGQRDSDMEYHRSRDRGARKRDSDHESSDERITKRGRKPERETDREDYREDREGYRRDKGDCREGRKGYRRERDDYREDWEYDRREREDLGEDRYYREDRKDYKGYKGGEGYRAGNNDRDTFRSGKHIRDQKRRTASDSRHHRERRSRSRSRSRERYTRR